MNSEGKLIRRYILNTVSVMDNSQSSDFNDAYDAADDGKTESHAESKAQNFYVSLLATTKEAFSSYESEIQKSTFPTYFATVLEDIWTCITCGLEDLINGLLSYSTVPINKVVEYLNDSVFLLQMLSNFYKSIIDSQSTLCCSLETLPKQTGLIIFSVFVHCRDSESLYGPHLRSVEIQLKDLFRNCHELQLTYLLIMEKHFNFDITEPQDKAILVEALKINLSIGQVVQSLDVKTMAEQWKAFTAICERYASYIRDTEVFLECSQILCTLIKDNIETAIEKDQDDKVIMRSLKVAKFTIKILLRICVIFRQSPNKIYSHVLELLQYIRINNVQCFEMSAGSTFASLMNDNVVIPSDCLLKELLLDEKFVSCISDSVSSLSCEEAIDDEHLLGLVLIITSAMECTAQNKRHKSPLKTDLVTWIYTVLPYSPILFRRTLFTEANHGTPTSIFDHMLTRTTALALTMTNVEFNALEKNMIEAILGTECVSAMFSSNLWLALASYISPQLLFNQLIWLCTMYKKLDAHQRFYRSPQKIHLTHTISRLFEVLDNEDKLKFCKQFRIHDEDNMSLWTALRIRNLPAESQQNAEEAIAVKLRTIFGRLHESDSADLLTQITNLAATCSFKTTNRIDDHLLRAWSKLCQEKETIVHGLDNNTVWFYDYVKALAALTDSVIVRLTERSAYFVKVLHVISCLTRTGNAEIKLILTNILCKLATFEVNEHNNLIDSQFNEAFTSLLQDSDNIVRINLLRTLRSCQNKYLDSMIANIVRENSLQETWQNLNETYAKGFKEKYCKFAHKCLDSRSMEVPAISVGDFKDSNSDDFYFESGGSEMLIETEVGEPSSKRGKRNTHEADSIIRSLEENVSLLVSHAVYTPEQLIRIQNVCRKLNNISH